MRLPFVLGLACSAALAQACLQPFSHDMDDEEVPRSAQPGQPPSGTVEAGIPSAANPPPPPPATSAVLPGLDAGTVGGFGFPLPDGGWAFLDGGIGALFPGLFDAGGFVTQPTRPPTPNMNCYWDDDALPRELELDAGLDSCKADTDGDGCGDVAEFVFGGCADERKVVAESRCYDYHASGIVKFNAPYTDGGPNGQLTLIANPTLRGTLAITALVSADGFSASNGASIINAPGGRPIRFAIDAQGFPSGLTQIELRLVDDTGRVVDTGSFVVAMKECPILI